MNFPITIVPPPRTKADGTLIHYPQITINELDITILDNPKKKTVYVQIKPFPLPLLIWQNEEYDNAGDYTQNQLENKLLEILGNDPITILQTLFHHVLSAS